MYLQKKRKNLANGVWATVKNYHRKVELAYNRKKTSFIAQMHEQFFVAKKYAYN